MSNICGKAHSNVLIIDQSLLSVFATSAIHSQNINDTIMQESITHDQVVTSFSLLANNK